MLQLKRGSEGKKYDIVIFGMSFWCELEHFNTRSKHVVLNLLGHPQVNLVAHVDFFSIQTARHFAQDFARRLIEGKGWGISLEAEKAADRLFVLRFMQPLPTLPSSAKVWTPPASAAINGTLSRLGFVGPRILWIYEPLATAFIGKLHEAMSVFDAVDDWREHPVFVRALGRKAIKAGYDLVQKRADIIFALSRELVAWLGRNRGEVHYFPNAISIEALGRARSAFHTPVPTELADLPRPRIGYAGTIQSSTDLELIGGLAAKNPRMSFVLIGPVEDGVGLELLLRRHRNVVHLGKKPYEILHRYIAGFDVCMVPNKPAGLSITMSPLKVLDYLAVGKPIVSTNVPGIKEFEDVIFVAETREEFEKLLHEALSTDTVEKQQRRRKVVMERTWDKVVAEMMRYIDNMLRVGEEKA